MRSYVWKGGVATADINIDTDPEPEILAGQDWCFVYGEMDWIANVQIAETNGTLRTKVFDDYFDAALLNDSSKISCI